MKSKTMPNNNTMTDDVTYNVVNNTALEEARRIAAESAHLREVACTLRNEARLTRELAQTLRKIKIRAA